MVAQVKYSRVSSVFCMISGIVRCILQHCVMCFDGCPYMVLTLLPTAHCYRLYRLVSETIST